MRRLLAIFLVCVSLLPCVCVLADTSAAMLPLLPYPKSVVMHQGNLLPGNRWRIAVELADKSSQPGPELSASLERFRQRVQQQTGKTLRFDPATTTKATLAISIESTDRVSDFLQQDESYQLRISDQQIQLKAQHTLGIVRGLETLAQLVTLHNQKILLPQLVIDDAPRFAWRGLLLDSSRHFFSVESIKRQIDIMAAAKYNLFHWHLTDDQGWRMESIAYPRLHQTASDGQYYTRAQIQAVVAYAREHGIVVLPEIDMPGHASAIALAYPEFMSAPGPYKPEIRWGVHQPTLDPSNEKVYEFVERILAEVVELFPFAYVHIGGDEVDPQHWQANAAIQAFMRERQLKDHHALQAYFNQRVQKILQPLGRKMIGWDEILHPDLPKDIVIQSWRGHDGISQAVSQGFNAILSTGYYLDQPQTAAYHYRQDPLPPPDVDLTSLGADTPWQSWSFSLPRKRGSPVTGRFTLVEPAAAEDARRVIELGFIDFKGKSRRPVQLQQLSPTQARFSLDTWMGPVTVDAHFVGDQVHGQARVGNVAYPMTGQLLARGRGPDALPAPEVHNPPLSPAQQARILGGTAALWSELVDENSLDLRLWPRAFVVAERLWSPAAYEGSPAAYQDENALYARLETTMTQARLSLGLQDQQQQTRALKRLAGTSDIAPLRIFAEALEPAHYYHRHHEKSAHHSYSRADRLDRLVDALPAENPLQRSLLHAWSAWHVQGDKNAKKTLQNQLKRWRDNHRPLSQLVRSRKALQHLQPLADDLAFLAQQGLDLLDACEQKTPLSDEDYNRLAQRLHQIGQMREEMVISTTSLVSKMLQSSANCP